MNKANLIIEEVNKVIIGKEKVIRKVWMTILSGGHVLLEDVPGVGKTTMALAFSKALGLSYRRIQFTPDVMPSDVVGFYYYNKENGKFEYRQGAVMTNLLLADEMCIRDSFKHSDCRADGIWYCFFFCLHEIYNYYFVFTVFIADHFDVAV